MEIRVKNDLLINERLFKTQSDVRKEQPKKKKKKTEAGWNRAQVLYTTKTPGSGRARTGESFLTLLRVLTRCRSWHRACDGIAEQGVRLDPEKRDSTLTPCSQSNIPLQEFPTRKTPGVFSVQVAAGKKASETGRKIDREIQYRASWENVLLCIMGGWSEGRTADRHSEGLKVSFMRKTVW